MTHFQIFSFLVATPLGHAVVLLQVSDNAGWAWTRDGGGETEPWVFCAEQFMQCLCPGKIRWGSPDHWKVVEAQESPLTCSTDKLGDPRPGDSGKHCECAVQRGSSFWRTLSPAVLPKVDAVQPVVSCPIFEGGAS